MSLLARMLVLPVWIVVAMSALPAAADYEGPSGYGAVDDDHELEVSHDGYPRGDAPPNTEAAGSADAPDYVVVEIEDGTPQEVDGETVIVVQEPEPVAATEEAPPSPRVVAVDEPAALCPEGIWVDGYWSYTNGQYIWVDGHCVVERVNYVFVHPRWDFYANVWWFVPGYYRPCGVWVGFGYYRPWHWFPPHPHPYYRAYRGVPVHRGVPGRRTVAKPIYPSRTLSPTGRVPAVGRRAPTTYGRTPTVDRTTSRVPSVGRAPTQRTPTVSRSPVQRSPVVGRAPAPRTPTINRTPAARTPTISRTPATRAPTVSRTPTTRSPMVDRVPTTRTPNVNRSPSTGRSVGTATRIGGFGRSGSSVSRTGSSRTSPVRRPSLGSGSRTGSGIFGRSGSSPVRPSMGSRPGFGRPSGLSRPSFGGFGGGRSVPTARGR